MSSRRAVVLYETAFGTTRRIAERVAAALGATLASADEPPDLAGVELLVVGGPTHVHGMSRASTRRAAVDQGAPGEPGAGVRELLEALPRLDGVRAAAFDTRADRPTLLTGSAARGIARALKRRGCALAAPPESFLVTGTPPELRDGELARAESWARSLDR